jgi:DNA-binding GntR family transcriptional regulator
MTPTVVPSLREQIREHIVEGIVSGRWKPGERIVERRIAVELEVSQTPVREALRELEALRLIESAPNKGVRVRALTAADLEEIYPVRAGLEQIAAELAAPRLAEDVSVLEPEVAALYEADRAGDAEAQVRHTVGFHRELVRAAGNSVLLHTWESLGIEVWTALSIRWLGTVQQSYAEEHEAVMEAFGRRDPRIAELVKSHVLGCAPAPRENGATGRGAEAPSSESGAA